MFIDIELFTQEKQSYLASIEQIKQTILSADDQTKQLNILKEEYKSNIRKYLPTALSNIDSTFNCSYSLYKTGSDVDANFNVIKTNIKKSKNEVVNDMEEYRKQLILLPLEDIKKHKVELSIDIIVDYCDDDIVDESKKEWLDYVDANKSQGVEESRTPSIIIPPLDNNVEMVSNPIVQNNVVVPGLTNNQTSQEETPKITQEVKYSNVLGNKTDVSHDTKIKFDYKTVLLKLLLGFIILPIIISIITTIVYYACDFIGNNVGETSFIYNTISSTSITGLTIIGAVIALVLSIIGSIFIKCFVSDHSKMHGRFMLAPFGILLTLIYFSQYILTFIGSNIITSSYDMLVFFGIYSNGIIIAFSFVIIYYLYLIFSFNTKARDIEDRSITPAEIIFTITLLYTCVIPLILIIMGAFELYEAISVVMKIYDFEQFDLVAKGLLIGSTLLLLVTNNIKKVKKSN